MNTQAELSLYPLKTASLTDAVDRFVRDLNRPGISVEPGQMSTVIAGENQAVFRAVSECFAKVAEHDQVVLVAKFSNACPTGAKKTGNPADAS